MKPIKFIDIQAENLALRDEINDAIQEVILDGDFIQGKAVREFEFNLAEYLGVKNVTGKGVNVL